MLLFVFTVWHLVYSLSFGLQSDIQITELELEDNGLLPEGAKYLGEMLKENVTIQRMVW